MMRQIPKRVMYGAAGAALVATSLAAITYTVSSTNDVNAASRPSPIPVAAARPTVPAGTLLRVRLDQTLDTARNRAGDRFTARLTSPVAIKGGNVLPRGTVVHGVVASSVPSGRLHHRGYLTLALRSVEVNGRAVPIRTSSITRVTANHKKRNLAFIGGGSGLGALIGGIAGGGKGALIGAGAGAAAGTTGAYATGKKQVRIPAESVLTFRLRQAATV